MPLAVRINRAGDDNGEEAPLDQQAEYVEPLLSWHARDLSDDEVANARDLVMLMLRRSGFTDRQIGRITWPERDPEQTRHVVQKRLRRMLDEFSAGGFRLAEIP